MYKYKYKYMSKYKYEYNQMYKQSNTKKVSDQIVVKEVGAALFWLYVVSSRLSCFSHYAD